MELSEFIFEAMCEASYDVDRKKKKYHQIGKGYQIIRTLQKFLNFKGIYQPTLVPVVVNISSVKSELEAKWKLS